jgi:hypothetical protein
MDSEFIKSLKKDIEEIQNRTLAIERRVEIAEREAIVSEREADAAWEFVMKTREEIKARREMPFWKKIFG